MEVLTEAVRTEWVQNGCPTFKWQLFEFHWQTPHWDHLKLVLKPTFPTFYYKTFQSEKGKELYSEPLSSHLDSTINILLWVLCHLHICVSSLSTHKSSLFFDAFQSEMKTSIHFCFKHFSIYINICFIILFFYFLR